MGLEFLSPQLPTAGMFSFVSHGNDDYQEVQDHLGKATAASTAALSSPASVCDIFVYIVLRAVLSHWGCLPRGKPAVTESRYPTFDECWVF